GGWGMAAGSRLSWGGRSSLSSRGARGLLEGLRLVRASSRLSTACFSPSPRTTKQRCPVDVRSKVEDAQKTIDLAKSTYTAQIDTSKGPIRLTFLPAAAPGHVKNFLSLAKVGFYDNLTFHRIIKGFMIQGGCPQGTGTGGPGYQIKAEFNSTPHEEGVLSMARSGDPNS